jgi:tetratricopeptide (TPR) repeat protein
MSTGVPDHATAGTYASSHSLSLAAPLGAAAADADSGVEADALGVATGAFGVVAVSAQAKTTNGSAAKPASARESIDERGYRDDACVTTSQCTTMVVMRGARFGVMLACAALVAVPLCSTPAAAECGPYQTRAIKKQAASLVRSESWADLEKLTANGCAKTDASCMFLHAVALARLAAQADTPTWADARAAFEGVLAVDPNLADAHVELADAALRLGDEKAALEHWTQAIRLRPDVPGPYASLADLYLRLGFFDHAEKILVAGIARNDTFFLRSLYGYLESRRGHADASLAQYEQAVKACGSCSEPGQNIAYFNLGASYAEVSPPRKAEAMQNLQIFNKRVCKGAAAQRYMDQCEQARAIAQKLGASLF